jgi:hypothetical protein
MAPAGPRASTLRKAKKAAVAGPVPTPARPHPAGTPAVRTELDFELDRIAEARRRPGDLPAQPWEK